MYITRNGKVITSQDISAVDELLHKVEQKPMWEVIEFLVSIFLKRNPEYADKLNRPLINEYGSDVKKEFRHLASIPNSLMDLIDYFYRDEIGSIGRKKFFREFVKRFPMFGVGKL